MSISRLCKNLNDSRWVGSICEIGLGVPFQAAYLNRPGASKTIMFTHSPYHKAFQKINSNRSVSREAVQDLAWDDLKDVLDYPGHKANQSFFAIAASGVHQASPAEGQSHGWVFILTHEEDPNWLDYRREYHYFHWQSLIPGLSRPVLGEAVAEYIAWFTEQILLKPWATWREAIQNLPEYLENIIAIDVLYSTDPNQKITLEEHLLFAKPEVPLLYQDGRFFRTTDILRKYQLCYRGSFNPPTLAHEENGQNAIFEVSLTNARKETINPAELARRIRVLNSLKVPIMISTGVPLFIDFHKVLMRQGASEMGYIVGTDTFNAIIDPSRLTHTSPKCFQDFERGGTGKFIVVEREGSPIHETFISDRLVWETKKSSYPHVSSTAVRNGDFSQVSPTIRDFLNQK